MKLTRTKSEYVSKPLNRRRTFLFASDVIVIQLASLLALLIRFEFLFSAIPAELLKSAAIYSMINTALTVIVFKRFKLYENIWSFAGIREFYNAAIACLICGIQVLVGVTMLSLTLPRSYFVLYTLLLAIGILPARVFFLFRQRSDRKKTAVESQSRIMLVGAGDAGNIIMSELSGSKYVNGRVVCIIDDDPEKRGGYIRGVRIVGGRESIPRMVKSFSVDQIIIAMPSVPRQTISGILEHCKESDCDIRILPGFCHFMSKEVNVSMLRDVEIEDLLGREPVSVNLDEIMDYVTGKTVLVTGGGGSIGSELCRQIASYSPNRLIILDIYENNAFDIQHELLRRYPALPLTILIASVRDANRINQIFDNFRPDIVYHAAAHKHVPLMEENPGESIKNNVFGTLNVAKAAGQYRAEKFILISTDKAVNPTSIMGATKRVCEMIVQSMDKLYSTVYASVRFGNVLGSNGSVIPLFKKQIEVGGPVTVTHKEIVRYFMTIPEAVSLVLQAGAYAQGSEIFILDMGEPVRIDDLARNLIKLSGFKPDVDIEIVYTGLRPGEKLFEELLMSEEGMSETEHKMIYKGRQIDINSKAFMEALNELRSIAEFDEKSIKLKLREIVDTYRPEPDEIIEPVPIAEEGLYAEDALFVLNKDVIPKEAAVV